MLERKVIASFQKTILDNYHVAERLFPWRETHDPYAIVVSEIMLQQTQTSRVVPKYLAWLAEFPTVHSLAAAPLSRVLEMWVGLGYNRRARFLHETAAIIVRDYQGLFPSDPGALDALPGIGPYTARAIAAFAFGIRSAFIETNIRTVFIHFFFPGRDDVRDSEIMPLIEETLTDDVRLWYYALMDYGAELKRTVINPGRQSAHHVRQSAFSGSRREARGAIIRYLAENGASELGAVAESQAIAYSRLEAVLPTLIAEGLVTQRGQKISLSNS